MNRTLWLKTVRDLRDGRAQTLALIFVVALGVSSFIALIGAYRDLDSSYQRTYEELRFADATFRVAEAPESVVGEVAAVEGVAAVSGRYVMDTGYELPDGEKIRSRLIGVPAGEQPAVNGLLVERGDYLAGGAERAAVVDVHFADVYGLAPGDSVTPLVDGEPVALEVAGVGTSPAYLIVSPSQQEIFPSASTFAVLFPPLSTVQAFAGAEGMVNDFAVRWRPGADGEEATAAVEAILEPYRLESTTPRAENPSHAALQADLAGYAELAVLMPGLILLVAAVSVYVMLGRLVRAQQPQIGVMKALGYRNRDVLFHYLTFSLTIAVVGAVIGVAGGLPLARAITGAYAAELGIPLVETRVYADLLALSAALSVALALLAGIGPARQSARLAPATAMRYDPADHLVAGRVTLVERLVGLPLWLRLPLRNVLRMRRRTLTTGLGIVFAFVLVLMVWGLFDSMNYFVSHTFEEVERWDVTATFERPQTPEILEAVRGWEGVTAVEPLVQLPVTVAAGDAEEDVLLTALRPEQEMHTLELPAGTAPTEALGEGEIVLTDALAGQMGVAVGDEVAVDTPFGRQTFVLSSTVEEMMSPVVYVGLEQAQQMAPMPAEIFNGLYLKVAGGRASAVKADLYGLPDVAGVQLKREMREDVESLLGLFYVFMGVMLLFALAMAAALIFNAMTVNVLERQRELATMRAIGAGGRRIAAEIAAENVILWLLALIPGLLLGRWVAIQMGEAFSAELFSFSIVIYPASYVITAVGILATMLVGALPAIRRVNRLDLAEATKILT